MITYCTNIHPGESWEDIFANLQTRFLAVKAAVSPELPFPIGLRLSHRAAAEMDQQAASQFHEWCQANGCFVPTINGFPFGPFHASQAREQVYLPDWRSQQRVLYTKRLADLLDQWLAPGLTGSISTVPVGFKSSGARGQDPEVRKNLISVLEHFDALRQKSGKEIILALEPEPGCVLETTEEVVHFFEQMAFPRQLRDCLGICFDCCHQAVEFEEPDAALKLLADCGIKIGKVQISSALRLRNPARQTLEQFLEPTYLHQVVISRPDHGLIHYNDLPEALDDYHLYALDEWRIHFHLPIFIDHTDSLNTTQFFIKALLPLLEKNLLLEVETYTWNALPAALQFTDMTRSIVREIEWLKTNDSRQAAKIATLESDRNFT